MSQPRRIRPGVTWFITRRTTRRHMLFRPDKDKTVQKVYWYVTAVLAEKFGIELHAVQVLSTHLHEVLTDVRGVLPAFLRERNRILANVLKRHRDWPEEVFQRSPASCVELFGPAAILKQIGYTLANCVEAGLVKNPENWPGVTVGAHEIGTRVVEVERPSMYFNPKKEALWPVRGTIALTMPKALAEAYGARASQVLRGVVHTAVERARRLAGRAGYVVGKVAQLYEVPFTRRSERPEPVGKRNPTFATAGDPKLTRQAVEDTRVFRTLYRQARDALKRGTEKVAFPEGAWRWCRELVPASMRRTGSTLDASLNVSPTAEPERAQGSSRQIVTEAPDPSFTIEAI